MKTKKAVSNEELLKFFDGALKVGGSYLIATTFDDVLEGIYLGISFDTLQFAVSDIHYVFLKPENIMSIKERGL
jgi:hypothetical protein